MKGFKSVSAHARLAACVLAFGALSAVHAATITVSPGQSIQKAVDQAVAGDTVRVLAGTYIQKVDLSGKSGASNAFITLKADPAVTLSGSGLSVVGRQGLITIRNANYIRVEGFDITSFVAKTTTPVGILVEGNASNIQIVNNKVHDIRNTSTCGNACPTGAHGIAVFGTNSTGIKNLLLQGNEVYKNVLQSSEAVVINGNVDGFEVISNHVHDNNNIGFDFIGYEDDVCAGCGELNRARNGIVRSNRAQNNSSVTNPAYGSDEGAAGGFYVDGGHHIIFEGNVSTGNDIGFEFASEHGGRATEDILMTNNFVYNNREVGLAIGGYQGDLGSARRIHVHNNAFYRNRGWGTEVYLQFKVQDSTFSNNIFFGEGSAAEDYYVAGTGNTGNVWGTNLWFGTNSVKSGLPGTVKVGNPLFVDPAAGNLNLKAGSPAIDAGTVSAALTGWSAPIFTRTYPGGAIPVNGTTDINGKARVQGSIDLGADEFGGSTPPPAVSIAIDGQTADWANVPALAASGSGGLTALKAYADATHLYVLVTGAIGANYDLFINNDNLATTGLLKGRWSSEGSDYTFENGVLYKYTGNGTSWLWSTSGVAQTGAQVAKSAGVLELKIARASLVGTGAAIRIGVSIADAGWATVGAIPAAGGMQAQFVF